MVQAVQAVRAVQAVQAVQAIQAVQAVQIRAVSTGAAKSSGRFFPATKCDKSGKRFDYVELSDYRRHSLL